MDFQDFINEAKDNEEKPEVSFAKKALESQLKGKAKPPQGKAPKTIKRERSNPRNTLGSATVDKKDYNDARVYLKKKELDNQLKREKTKEKKGVEQDHTDQHKGEIKPERMTDAHKKAYELEGQRRKDLNTRYGPKKESLNFSEFVSELVHPLYEEEGGVPKCPPGYRFDVKTMMCVPKTKKDSVGPDQKQSDKDLKPGNGPGYRTWGSSGYNGDGYAWEEGPSGQMYSAEETVHEALSPRFDEYDELDKEFEKKDREMKYGKGGKESSLRPGEVRKYNTRRKRWDSNK